MKWSRGITREVFLINDYVIKIPSLWQRYKNGSVIEDATEAWNGAKIACRLAMKVLSKNWRNRRRN